MIEKTVQIPSKHRQITGHWFSPERVDPSSIVVIVPEVYGYNKNMQDLSRDLVKDGFSAFAVDLYNTGEAAEYPHEEQIREALPYLMLVPPQFRPPFNRINEESEMLLTGALEKAPENRRSTIRKTLNWVETLSLDQYVQELDEVAGYLQQSLSPNGRVGIIGLSMGGHLAARLITQSDRISACAIFYGRGPDLTRLGQIRCPVIGFYGGQDKTISGTVPDFARAMSEHGKEFAYHIYPSASHSFMNRYGGSFEENAALDSWEKLIQFLRHKL